MTGSGHMERNKSAWILLRGIGACKASTLNIWVYGSWSREKRFSSEGTGDRRATIIIIVQNRNG